MLDEPLFRQDGRMAGLQIRVAGMAEALAEKGHDIVVAEPAPGSATAKHPGFRFVDVADIEKTFPIDVSIVHPLFVKRHYGLLRRFPMVVDAYEFPFGSWLGQSADQLPVLGERVMYDYRRTMADYLTALTQADRILCGTELHRDCYLSMLCMLGKINPKYYGSDLVMTVHTGTSPNPPTRVDPTNARLLSIKKRGPVVLWMGGIYPWFDMDTYLAAMPLIVSRQPSVQFLFAGIGGVYHAGQKLTQPGAVKLLQTLEDSPDLKARTHILDYTPYAERHQVYQASDIGLCTYGDHLETTFSMRARLIDMIWGGLPTIATAGDPMSRFIETHDIGSAVPAADPGALANAVVALVADNAARERMSANAREAALGSLGWDRQIESLHQFCLAPQMDPSGHDRLVQRTAANIVQIGNGWRWRVREKSVRLRWRANRILTIWRAEGSGGLVSRIRSRTA